MVGTEYAVSNEKGYGRYCGGDSKSARQCRRDKSEQLTTSPSQVELGKEEYWLFFEAEPQPRQPALKRAFFHSGQEPGMRVNLLQIILNALNTLIIYEKMITEEKEKGTLFAKEKKKRKRKKA